jgi:hypothetical protein
VLKCEQKHVDCKRHTTEKKTNVGHADKAEFICEKKKKKRGIRLGEIILVWFVWVIALLLVTLC